MNPSSPHLAARFGGAVQVIRVVLVVLAAAAALAPQARAAPGLQWTTPMQVDGAPPFSSGSRIDGMSCPTTSLCVGIDFDGRALTSTNPAGGGAWTRRTISSPDGLQDIDCASATRCVAVTGTAT